MLNMRHQQEAARQLLGFQDYNAVFGAHGYAHDEGLTAYLRIHYERYLKTRELIYQTRPAPNGQRFLDVGAHWLHQALMYAMDGFEVIAVDLPDTFSHAHVQRLAKAFNVTLISYADLSRPVELDHLPDGFIDIILFSEIIEHITFNPVEMWRTFYRLLAPGGKIVVTTPNYYALEGRFWEWRRLWGGGGGGLTVEEILEINTYGPHWKEYSAKELSEYFLRLSPDFQVGSPVYLNCYPPKKPRQGLIQEKIGFLRQNLHLEIDLPEKQHGIVVQPHW